MCQFIWEIIKSWMAINFIICGLIKRACFFRNRGVYVLTLHNPNADAFHSASIYIPCIFNRHLSICGMQAAYMLMIQSLLTADKNFPKRPVGFLINIF